MFEQNFKGKLKWKCPHQGYFSPRNFISKQTNFTKRCFLFEFIQYLHKNWVVIGSFNYFHHLTIEIIFCCVGHQCCGKQLRVSRRSCPFKDFFVWVSDGRVKRVLTWRSNSRRFLLTKSRRHTGDANLIHDSKNSRHSCLRGEIFCNNKREKKLSRQFNFHLSPTRLETNSEEEDGSATS